MKILVVAPSWIGDLVMSQCLYKELLKVYPHCEIEVLAPQWCLPVLEKMSEVTKTILMPIGHGEFNFKGRLALAKILRNRKYDQAYILPNSWKSALIPFLAKIPKRIGWKGESRYFLINSMLKNKKKYGLLIEKYCALAYSDQSNNFSFNLPEISKPNLMVNSLTNDLYTKFNINEGSDFIGICPGAEYGPAKKWPAAYYANVVSFYLNSHPNSQALIFGSKKDIPTANEVMDNLPKEHLSRVKILAGSTTINEAIDIIATCKLILCNDSGLMHIAAAVGCKLVAVYGSTSTLYTPPLTSNALIIESQVHCHPCFKRECKFKTYECLHQISPEYVISQIQAKWKDL